MNKLSQKHQQGSMLYQIESSVNFIIAASAPIISLLNRVHGIDASTPEPDSWQEICKHELNTCLEQCHKQGYQQVEIVASAITTWINATCIWPYSSEFKELDLEQIELMLSEASENLEILELIYILSRLGMPIAKNPQINELKTQELFYVITSNRQKIQANNTQRSNIQKWQAATQAHKVSNQKWYCFLTLGLFVCLISIWHTWQIIMAALIKSFHSNPVF